MLVALFVVVDRVAVVASQRDVARRIQVDQHLRSTPHVAIHGFPFLTQMVAGRYDDVDVDVRGLHAGSLAVSRLTVHLQGAHVPLADVFSQRLSRVRIDRARADIVLTFADLNRFLADRHLVLAPAGNDTVRVTATVAGVIVRADAHLSVRANGLELSAAGGIPAFEVPLSGLPFNVRLESVQVTRNGIVVSGSAVGLVLRA